MAFGCHVGSFWGGFGPQNGARKTLKTCPKSCKYSITCWVQFFMVLGLRFGVPNLPKMSQHGIQKPSRTILKIAVFSVFYSKSGTPGLPREPQDSSRWPPGAFPKKGQLFDSILTPEGTPKLPKNMSKSASKIGPKPDPKKNRKWTSFGPQTGPQNP